MTNYCASSYNGNKEGVNNKNKIKKMTPKTGFDRWGEGPQHLHNEYLWEQGEGVKYRQGGGTQGLCMAPEMLTLLFFSPKSDREQGPAGRVHPARPAPGAQRRGDHVRTMEAGGCPHLPEQTDLLPQQLPLSHGSLKQIPALQQPQRELG